MAGQASCSPSSKSSSSRMSRRSSGPSSRSAARKRQAAAATPAPAPRKSYTDLFPACKGGRGDIADTRDGYCDRCASEREWQQRRAERTTVAPFTLNPLAE